MSAACGTEAMLGCAITELCLVDRMQVFDAALPSLGAGPSVRYRYGSTSAAKLFLYAAWTALVDIMKSRALCGSEALTSCVLCVHAATAVACALCTP